jgi:hypothetical protein
MHEAADHFAYLWEFEVVAKTDGYLGRLLLNHQHRPYR